jgi:hypothetical protein
MLQTTQQERDAPLNNKLTSAYQPIDISYDVGSKVPEHGTCQDDNEDT